MASLDNEDVETVITLYLKRLYVDISCVKMQSSFPLPSRDSNYLNKLVPASDQETRFADGPYGKCITIDSWEHTDFDIGANLFPGAKFVLAFRADVASADYTVYFRVRYPDRDGNRRTIWLGLSSAYRVAGCTYAERTFPAQAATTECRILQAEFDDLLRKGFVLGSCSVDYIEKMRFRAGDRDFWPCPGLGIRGCISPRVADWLFASQIWLEVSIPCTLYNCAYVNPGRNLALGALPGRSDGEEAVCFRRSQDEKNPILLSRGRTTNEGPGQDRSIDIDLPLSSVCC
jgi:hypothetical protein